MVAGRVRNLAPAHLSLAVGHALVVRLAQHLDHITLEIAHWLGVDAVVDGLVRHAVFMALGVSGRQCDRYLFERTLQAQQMMADAKQDTLYVQLWYVTFLYSALGRTNCRLLLA